MKKVLVFLSVFLFITSFRSQENCESAKIKYLDLNPDVKKNGMDAWAHYTIFGKKEGRIWPNCDDQYQQINTSSTTTEQNRAASFQNVSYYPILKLQGNKFFINDQLYNGLYFSYYDNKQIKSIQEIKDGIINGNIIEYWFDKSYDSKKYRDTSLINDYNIDLQKAKTELSLNILDTTKSSKDERDFLNTEIGGYEKLQKLREKNSEGKLNKKKKEEFDHYQELVKIKNNSIQKLNNSKKLILDLEKKVKIELSKEVYVPVKSSEYGQLDTKKDGKSTLYNSNGKKISEGEYKENLENNKWIYYYSNSNVSEEAEFEMGKLNGLRKIYYENGKLKAESIYKNGELHGNKKEYFDNGSIQSSCEYVNGKKSGLFSSYNIQGNKLTESTFLDDKKNGKEIIYSTTGILLSEYNYSLNEKDGPFKEYHDNGKLKLEGNYSKNKRNGIVKKYYESGKIKVEGNYANDKRNGKFKSYFESGQLEGDVTLVNDKEHGSVLRYYPSGKIMNKATINTNSLAKDHLIGDFI